MIELPTERSKIESYNPKLMIIIGKPKSGKSTFISAIDNNLVIDLEDGYKSLSVMKVQARTAKDLFDVKDSIIEMGKKLQKMPYKYITIDNASRLEQMAIEYANNLYRKTQMGAKWGYKTDTSGIIINDPKTGKPIVDPEADVRNLPNGSGYLYVRIAVNKLIDMFQPLCKTLILVCHVKDRQIKVNGEELSEMTVDLAGKTGDIICGKADAIGYIYREGKKTYLSFEGGDNILREARPLHLRGKKIMVMESDDDNKITVNLKEVLLDE